MTGPAAVVVAALAGTGADDLEVALRHEGAAALREAMAARARRWASAVAPDAAFEATSLAAAAVALHDHGGPVLLVAPDVPLLDAALAGDALDDLAGECDVTVGVAHDGRPYLIAAREVALLDELDDPTSWIAVFGTRGLRMGMLRSERRLRSAIDVQALAVDPTAPAELLPLLRPRPG